MWIRRRRPSAPVALDAPVRRSARRRLALRVCATAAVLGAVAAVARAVTISPTLVVLDPRRRIAEVALFNNGAAPEELSLKLRYGTWEADSLGRAEVVLSDSLPGLPKAGWVTVFPSRVVLLPGARQTVRVVARPPAGLADGEYPFRLLIASQPAEVTAPSRPDGITTKLMMQITQSVPVYYRVGSLTTRLAFAGARATPAPDSVAVDLDFRHEGAAAWVGTATLTLLGADGATVFEQRLPVTVSRSERRRLVLPRAAAGPVVTAVRIRMATRRDDLARDDLLPAPPLDTLVRLLPP